MKMKIQRKYTIFKSCLLFITLTPGLKPNIFRKFVFPCELTKFSFFAFVGIQLLICNSFLCDIDFMKFFRRQAQLCKNFYCNNCLNDKHDCATIYFTTDFSTTSTFVRQLFVPHGFLCDTFFVRHVFCANGKIRRERRLMLTRHLLTKLELRACR